MISPYSITKKTWGKFAAMQFQDNLPVANVNDLYRRIAKLGEGSYATVYKSESMSVCTQP